MTFRLLRQWCRCSTAAAAGIADLDASLHLRIADDAKNGARLDATLPRIGTST